MTRLITVEAGEEAASWDRFAPHRAQTMRLIVAASEGMRGGVALLGCGPCSDVDLPWLCRRFGQVHLVDRDLAAVARGVRPHVGEKSASIQVHAPVDLLADVTGRRGRLRTLVGACDLVVSTCVLSQLIDQMPHEALESVEARHRHIRDMVRLLRPGGRGVLVTDVVSNLTAPELLARWPADGAATLRNLDQAGNFFTALNPFGVIEAVRNEPGVARAEGGGPWIWDQATHRSYLVVGVTFETRGERL